MYIIGLTGGIGSGKSTAVDMLRELGAGTVDADQVAREIVEPGTPALEELAQQFPGIINSDGTLNRAELATQAFATQDGTDALNGITQPHIEDRIQSLFDQAQQNGTQVLVYDMPLLLERDQDKNVDLVVVVDAPDEQRIRRVVENRGLDPEDVRNRIKRQIGREDRLAHADVVLDNSGSIEQLHEQIESLWNTGISRHNPSY